MGQIVDSVIKQMMREEDAKVWNGLTSEDTMPDRDDRVRVEDVLPESIELSRNAKGGYAWTIKLRGAERMEDEVLERVAALNAKMAALYPKEG